LKFSDVIVAVAYFLVVAWLVNAVLNFALIPMSTSLGGDLAFILSALVSAIIVGYVFAGKIREESRMASIGKVVVLSALVMMLIVWTTGGATAHYSAWVDENLKNMYNTTSWATVDWFWFEMTLTMAITAVYGVFTLVFGFIGLYVGSMRKPSAKTKV
jgi:hypothetical protein